MDDVVERIVRYTTTEMNLEREDWQKGVFLNGLLASGDRALHATAETLVDEAVATQTSDGEFSYGPMDRNFQLTSWGVQNQWSGVGDTRYIPNTNTAVLGYAVLAFHLESGAPHLLAAAERQIARLLGANRTRDGAIWQHRGVPQIYIDGTYMMCPFLARAARVKGDPALADEALTQLRVYVAHLLDKRAGLCRHVWCEKPDSYPQSTFWSRGNGWLAACLVDVLAELPPQHAAVPELRRMFHELMQHVLPLQDRSGLWHNLLDDDSTYLETSGTALFAYALGRARRAGWLELEAGDAERRALAAVRRLVDRKGVVIGVAGVPGGPEAPPKLCLTGQGTALLALGGSSAEAS